MANKRSKRSALPQQEAHTLTDLDQIKVLADPLRIRILEAFCEERTTKQVAELLGEKVTKLYHHVDALERVGLISLSRTRQNRGTVEKYYLAVARTFRADSRAFQPKENQGTSVKRAMIRQMMSTIFDTTSAELALLMDRVGEGADAMDAIEEQGIVSFLEIRASKAQLDEIRARLQAAVDEATAEGDDDAVEGCYRLTLAYYPLDPSPSKSSNTPSS
jgi:DNA-binding transcriptional ArsR family regulator